MLWAAPIARAAAGDLDPTFGGDGKVAAKVFRYPQGTGLAIQDDGKLVVSVGSPWADVFGVMRFLADGAADAAFGLEGRVATDFRGRSNATDLLLQPDGKIILAGWSGKRMVLARYLTDGSLDNSFGGDGKMSVGFPDRSTFALAAELTPQGSIVLAGGVSRSEGRSSFAVMRLTPDGSLDPTFSRDGKIVISIGKQCVCSVANDVVVAADGSIAAVGQVHRRAAIVVLDSGGALDGTFGGGDGMRLTKLGSKGYVGATAVALATNGNLMVSGWSWGSYEPIGFLASLTRDGPMDPSFSGDGIAHFPAIGFPASIAFQPDGKIIVAGGDCCGGGSEVTFALGRFTEGGARDLSFGAKGFVALGYDELAFSGWAAVSIQVDGRIVVTGGREAGALLLARYEA